MDFGDDRDEPESSSNSHEADDPGSISSKSNDELPSKPLSFSGRPKVAQIVQACTDNGNIPILAALATSTSGLVDDEVRRNAWPLLLGYTPGTSTTKDDSEDWRNLPRHKDEDQVKRDVDRAFIYYPKNESLKTLDRRKEQLSDVIIQTLRKYPMLSYFQGFHDIAQVFLLVLGVEQAAQAIAHLALLRIRDFMLPSLSPSLAHLHLLPAILYEVDAKLYQHLSQTKPFFALAATLTLYAHDIQEYGDIARLFDFLLAHGAVVSVYFFAIIILSRREELFEIPADEPEMLHSVLSKLPKPLDLESLISKTMAEFLSHPPEMLPFRAWSKISTFSVLKTTYRSSRSQTIEDGKELFAYQQLQLRRAEMHDRIRATIWKYRRPVSSIGLAIIVGLISVWWRKYGAEATLMSGLKNSWTSIGAVFRR